MKNLKIFFVILFFVLMISPSIADSYKSYMAGQMAGMHMCIPGTYMEGYVEIKQTGSYCHIRQNDVQGHPNMVKVCKFPLGFYKKMNDDSLKMSRSEYNRKYSNIDSKYCKLIRK